MKIQSNISLALLSMLLPCRADLFTLKDGTTLDGDVLKETEDSYLLDVRISRSIRDEKAVKKSDVAKREKTDPSVEIFKTSIIPLYPVPDFSKEAEYAKRIKVIDKFLKDHPNSTKTKETTEIKNMLQKESDKIRDGAVKYKEEIVSKEDYEKNRYELDARQAESRVNNYLAADQIVAALREYARMGTTFPNTVPYCALGETMNRRATSYLAQVEELQNSYDARMKKREEGLSQMSANDRRVTETAIAEEKSEFDARYKSEKDGKIGWISIDPNHLESLKDALTYGKQEVVKLAAIPAKPEPDAGAAYRKITGLFAEKSKAEEITKAIGEARAAKVPEEYTKQLEEDVKKIPPPAPPPAPVPPAPETPKDKAKPDAKTPDAKPPGNP